MPPCETNKPVYTYNIVVKDKGKPPIPVSEFVSNSHTDTQIACWIGSFRDQLQQLLCSKIFPFKVMVTDLSRAMSNAVLSEMVGMPMNLYLKACYQAKESGVVCFAILCWCYSHLLNDMKRKANKMLPENAVYNAAKQFFKFVMASIAKTSELKQALLIWIHAV